MDDVVLEDGECHFEEAFLGVEVALIWFAKITGGVHADHGAFVDLVLARTIHAILSTEGDTDFAGRQNPRQNAVHGEGRSHITVSGQNGFHLSGVLGGIEAGVNVDARGIRSLAVAEGIYRRAAGQFAEGGYAKQPFGISGAELSRRDRVNR